MRFLLQFAIGMTIAFLVLKVFGCLSWSYLWLCSPLWIYVLYFIDHMVHLTIAHCESGFDFPRKDDDIDGTIVNIIKKGNDNDK